MPLDARKERNSAQRAPESVRAGRCLADGA
jgi:hypothetical protein